MKKNKREVEFEIGLDGTVVNSKKKNNNIEFEVGLDGTVRKNTPIEQKKKENTSKKDDASVFKKIGKTIINIPTLMGEGAMKTVENVGDWANKASEVIDKPVKKALSKLILGYTDEEAEKFIQEELEANRKYREEDTTQNILDYVGWDDEFRQKYEKDSFVRSDNTAGQVVKAVGGMVPQLVVGQAVGSPLPTKSTAGLSTGKKILTTAGNVGKTALSTAPSNFVLATSAYGGALEEAYKAGATEEEAEKYAFLSTTTELATEWITGGIPGIEGTGFIDNGVKGLIDKSTGKLKGNVSKAMAKAILNYGYEAVGEGLEEAISEIVSPMIKNATYSEGEKIDWNNVFQSAIIGATVGGFLNAPGTISDYKNDLNSAKATLPTGTVSQQEINNTPIEGNPLINNQKATLPIANMTVNNAANTENNNSFEFVQSDNAKINNLRESASRYLDNSDASKSFISTAEKLVNDKGYNIVLDNNLTSPTGNQVNAQIKTLENGEVEIRINPNSERAGEFLLVHEVTHSIETQEMVDLVMDYASKHSEFNDALESLKQTYGTDSITSEVLADISGQLFGNQEFINSLSLKKPNIFKRIYNSIISLANKITGNSRESLFIRDLKNKWEIAYKTQQNNLSSNTMYMITGKKGHIRLTKELNNPEFMNNYNEALEMDKNNAAREDIRKDTGWYKDVNGDWKFEISDKSAKLKIKPKVNTTYKLSDLLSHDFIYDMYKRLGNTKVIFKDLGSYRGMANKVTGTLYINNNLINNTAQIEKTLLHEIQHNIQVREHFQPGTTKEREGSYEKYKNNFGETEARETSNRKDLSFEDRIKNPSKTQMYKKNSKNKLYTKEDTKWYYYLGGTHNANTENNQGEIEETLYSSIHDGIESHEELDNSSFFDEKNRYSLSEPTQDSQGRKLTEGQKKFFKSEDANLLDKDGNIKVLYHGTPYGKFTTFKGKMFFFSEDYRFARDYADSKSFEQGIDGETNVIEAYIKAENVFDVTDPSDIQKLREALPDEIRYWSNDWDKETLLERLQRRTTLEPKWKPEQIVGKKFGDYIGDDRSGYNTDMFVGVNENNEIVYISQERGLQQLTEAEKAELEKKLMAGEEATYVTYETMNGELTEQQIQEEIKEAKEYGEKYKKETGFENEMVEYTIKRLKSELKYETGRRIHKLTPRTATQENTELDDIDNWTYFETAYDPKTRKDIVDIIKDLGYDAINIYEEGKSNYIVFNPNQIKNVTNENPTDDPDIRYSQQTNEWDKYIKNNYKSPGTKTKFNNIRKKDNISTEQKLLDKKTDKITKKYEKEKEKSKKYITKNAAKILEFDNYNQKKEFQELITDYYDNPNYETIRKDIKEKFSEKRIEYINDELKEIKRHIRGTDLKVDDYVKKNLTDYNFFRKSNFNKLKLKNDGMSIDSFYTELTEQYPSIFSKDITNEVDQLYRLSEFMDEDITLVEKYHLDDNVLDEAAKYIYDSIKNEDNIDDLINSISISPKEIRKEKTIEYREFAESFLENSDSWNDKKMGLSYKVNTMKRNFYDVMGKTDGERMYTNFIEPIFKHNSQMQKDIQSYNSKIEKLKLNEKESIAVQMFGEYKYNPETLVTGPQIDEFIETNKLDYKKISEAVEVFRGIYDEVFPRINSVLKEQGYKEIEYRKGYFPHFTVESPNSTIGKFLEKMGWKFKDNSIPTDIAGITEMFKPGKVWTSFSQRRKGKFTDYNALQGFDNYIRGAMETIYFTEDIQKLRALENEIRYQHSDSGVQAQIDEIHSDNSLTFEEKQEKIDKIYAKYITPMNNLVTELRDYTNGIANKKSGLDRTMESLTNRKVYSVMQNISNRLSANMVGLNFGSAITNFIPITQATSQVKTKYLLKGLKEAVKNQYTSDGFETKSIFLTSRLNAADRLYKTKLEKLSDKANFMFEGIDSITSNAIVRGKYYENISKGMSEYNAMRNADEFARDLIAGRTKGEMPTAFNSKNPLIRMFTAFQLEVNNQYGYMFKDLPRDLKDEGLNKLIGGFIKMFIGAWLYNQLTEKVVGRKSAFSPADTIEEIYSTATNKNLDTK